MTFDDWPWQYSFPPFFTVQPNLQTRKAQLSAWCDLVLKYHKANNLYVLDVREAQGSPLFCNADINRKLSLEGIAEVMSELHRRANAEPLDKGKTRWHVLWHTIDEWASILYSWADETGQTGSVCTFYEITNASDQEFSGIDQDVLLKALRKLEQAKKVEIIHMDDAKGVKFF
ncbi:Vacuolar protein [Nesidiocoris tenuis]|uniref:Vacuolar protein-sorting-associated protein 25 n=1 Tax=Nesidiocoris tenuis TaxID=355587 RepID=A0ABN7BGN9_9HEMI|nr:Vacuolar protein [Nesidiocoris tenuis]